MIVADYSALYKQGSLERIRASAQELYILVLNIHEDIRTTLTFREQTCAPINLKRPGAATCHDPGVYASSSEAAFSTAFRCPNSTL